MTALTHLVALMAVACCLAAVVQVSASTPVTSSEHGPDDVSSPPKKADDNLTVEEKTLQLQEFFNEASKEIFGYLKNLARRKIAEDTDDDLSGAADFVPDLLLRFRREADSTTGGHHEHHPEVNAAAPTTATTSGVAGYPPATGTPKHYAAAAPTPVLVGEVPHNYAAVVPAPVPVNAAVPAPPPQYGPPPQYSPPPQYGPPPQYAPHYVPPAVRVPRPVYWTQPPVKAKSFPEIWEFFITKPLEESYNDFIAYIPVNALYSLVFEHQYFDFESLRTYTANKFGFISAMQNVFHAPSEQLEEIGRYFDMMTRVLPTRFFGEGRSVDDLLREIRLYFAVNYPLLQFLAPPRNATTHYYAK